MNFNQIPQFPAAHYEIDIQWNYLEEHVNGCEREGLDLNPPFQRAHVWTPAQQTAFVEFLLRGGEVSRTIFINAPQWERDGYAGATLVDGKQRLEAVRGFMRGTVKAFDHSINQFEGHLRLLNGRLKWRVLCLASEAGVLDFYLGINTGGTPHSPKEIAKVRAMRLALGT